MRCNSTRQTAHQVAKKNRNVGLPSPIRPLVETVIPLFRSMSKSGILLPTVVPIVAPVADESRLVRGVERASPAWASGRSFEALPKNATAPPIAARTAIPSQSKPKNTRGAASAGLSDPRCRAASRSLTTFISGFSIGQNIPPDLFVQRTLFGVR